MEPLESGLEHEVGIGLTMGGLLFSSASAATSDFMDATDAATAAAWTLS